MLKKEEAMALARKVALIFAENGALFFCIFIFAKVRQIVLGGLIELATSWRGIKIDGSFEIRGVKNIKIGKNFYAKHGLWLEAITRNNESSFSPQLKIGDNFSCSMHAHISCVRQITIGNDVLLGSNVLITDNHHGQYDEVESSNPLIPPSKRPLGGVSNITIGDRVWICDDVKVLPGSSIGQGSIIGAGSIVNGAIPENCIALGRPAKPTKLFNQNSEKWEKINELS